MEPMDIEMSQYGNTKSKRQDTAVMILSSLCMCNLAVCLSMNLTSLSLHASNV